MSPKVKIPEGEDYSWFQAAVRGSLGLMSPSGSDLRYGRKFKNRESQRVKQWMYHRISLNSLSGLAHNQLKINKFKKPIYKEGQIP